MRDTRQGKRFFFPKARCQRVHALMQRRRHAHLQHRKARSTCNMKRCFTLRNRTVSNLLVLVKLHSFCMAMASDTVDGGQRRHFKTWRALECMECSSGTGRWWSTFKARFVGECLCEAVHEEAAQGFWRR